MDALVHPILTPTFFVYKPSSDLKLIAFQVVSELASDS